MLDFLSLDTSLVLTPVLVFHHEPDCILDRTGRHAIFQGHENPQRAQTPKGHVQVSGDESEL